MSTRYGRFKFLRDAERMGMNARTAFSEVELRRQRDRLMTAHHPDRGGSKEMAAQINDTYTRMRKWLVASKAQQQRSAEEVKRGAETRDSGEYILSARRWLESRQMFMASIIVGAGYAMLKNRRH
jgi:hypothetical protein